MMAEHAVLNEHMAGASASAVRLADVVLRYFDQHARELPSGEAVSHHAARIIDYFGNISVADCTLDEQEGFVRSLVDDELSPGYVRRILTTLRAALQRAYKRGEIDRVPFVQLPEKVPPMRQARKLNVSEVAALITAAAAQSDRLLMFMLLSLNTAARPSAIYDLTVDQVNVDDRLIDLNPPGRAQTKKHRPVLPITDSLLPWVRRAMAESESGHLIEYQGKPVKSLKKAFAKAVTTAGLERAERVTPYSLRHTMGKALRSAGVPRWEVEGILGHAGGTTEIYAEYDPDHLAAAARAIDSYLTEVQLLLGGDCCISPLSNRAKRDDALRVNVLRTCQ